MSKELEAKYGKRNLRRIEVNIPESEFNDAEKIELIIAKPSRKVIEAITATNGDEAKASKILVSNCVVGGDLERMEEGDVYLAVMQQLRVLFQSANAGLKKY